ncbi:MAG: hypothetical protein CVV41_04160 [Candidatus Riflebacteria bacterium HGW-Riflebacteria-1]|jgi:hypothetical protein|nr:MAG: hypothetical protein CVV41_04160 [Candidatus Riflebacteria bacterium HGW-Riflebacteria-1]
MSARRPVWWWRVFADNNRQWRENAREINLQVIENRYRDRCLVVKNQCRAILVPSAVKAIVSQSRAHDGFRAKKTPGQTGPGVREST